MLQASNKWLVIMFTTPSSKQVCKKVNSMCTKDDPEGLTLQNRMLEAIAKNFSKRTANSSANF